MILAVAVAAMAIGAALWGFYNQIGEFGSNGSGTESGSVRPLVPNPARMVAQWPSPRRLRPYLHQSPSEERNLSV